jgi:hypothetical protein
VGPRGGLSRRLFQLTVRFDAPGSAQSIRINLRSIYCIDRIVYAMLQDSRSSLAAGQQLQPGFLPSGQASSARPAGQVPNPTSPLPCATHIIHQHELTSWNTEEPSALNMPEHTQQKSTSVGRPSRVESGQRRRGDGPTPPAATKHQMRRVKGKASSMMMHGVKICRHGRSGMGVLVLQSAPARGQVRQGAAARQQTGASARARANGG